MNLRENTIKSQTIYKGKVITLNVDTVVTPAGNQAQREIVLHPGGVGIVPIDEDNNVYLVEQYRIPYDEVLLEIPAGKLDSKDEDPMDAAKRELSEETGFTAKDLTFIGNFYPSVGFLDEDLRLFCAKGLIRGESHPDEDEFVNVVKLPFDVAIEMVLANKIKDGKTIAALLMIHKMNIYKKGCTKS